MLSNAKYDSALLIRSLSTVGYKYTKEEIDMHGDVNNYKIERDPH